MFIAVSNLAAITSEQEAVAMGVGPVIDSRDGRAVRQQHVPLCQAGDKRH
jgi:hypothetical protein